MDFATACALWFRCLYYFGLMPFKFSEDKSHLITRFIDNFAILVSLFAIITASFFAIALRALVETIFDIKSPRHSSEVISIMQWMQVFISGFIYSSLFISSIFKKRQHMKLIESLISLDNDLIKFFNYDPNYRKFKKNLNFLLINLVAYNVIVSFSLIVYITYMKNNFLDNRMVPVYAASQTYPQYHSMQYCVLIIYMTKRLKIIENLAKSNLTRKEFKNLVDINGCVRQIVHTLNNAFGLGQFLIIVNNNIIITFQIYIDFHMLSSRETTAFYMHWSIAATWWLLLFIGQTFYTAIVGDDLKVQVRRTNKAMLENTNHKFEGREMGLLSGCPLAEPYGNKVECTAGGFFVVDRSLITLMFSTIASYLLIMIQFQQNANH